MKKMILIGTLLCGTHGLAAVPGKLLASKVSSPGFVKGESRRVELCELYSHQMIIKRSYGIELETKQVVALEIQGNVAKYLEMASQEAVTEYPNRMCDGPSTDITAYKAGAGFPLSTTGGCGTPGLVRKGPASGILIDILDQYCPGNAERPVDPGDDLERD